MKTAKVQDSIGGWYIGNFPKAAYKTSSFEASYKIHKKDEKYGYYLNYELDNNKRYVIV